MPFLPPTLSFPEPGAFLRFRSSQSNQTEYLRLMERQVPLIYPRRLELTDPGGTSASLSLDEINPSNPKKHRFMAYIGVQPGALYYISHPYDHLQLQWDEAIKEIDEDLTRGITWEESPYEAPRFSVWIEPDRYPQLKARNLMDVATHPEFIIMAALYSVLEQADLPKEIVAGLRSGAIVSIPVSFGGGI